MQRNDATKRAAELASFLQDLLRARSDGTYLAVDTYVSAQNDRMTQEFLSLLEKVEGAGGVLSVEDVHLERVVWAAMVLRARAASWSIAFKHGSQGGSLHTIFETLLSVESICKTAHEAACGDDQAA